MGRFKNNVSLQTQRSGRMNHLMNHLACSFKSKSIIKIHMLMIKIIDILVLLAIAIVITLIFSQRIHVPFFRP